MRRVDAAAKVWIGLLTLSIALAFSASAQAATNLVPNPGFEQGPCGFGGFIICSWNELTGTMSQDMATFHSGSASMQLTGTGNSVEATTIQGVCIAIGPGVHPAEFWYRTTSSLTNRVSLSADWYPNGNCSVATSGFASLTDSAPTTNGTWTHVTGTLTAPAGTGSAFFAVGAGCNSCSGLTVNFDDLDIEQETLAVTVASVAARRTPAGVAVRWRTGSELDLLGFNVYREVHGRRVRLNTRVIAAHGAGAYSFVDRKALRRTPVRYWLQAVNIDGSRSWYGPARLTR